MVDIDPKHIKAHLQLGSLLMAARQFGKSDDLCPEPYRATSAICEARYVVKLDPNNAEAFVLMGNALMADKHQQDAVDAYTKAIS